MSHNKLLRVQLHDPARGPFDPQIDTAFSMARGTRTMRLGKTADKRRRLEDRRRHIDAQVRTHYMMTEAPCNSRQHHNRVMTRFRKNRKAGLV